MRERHIIDTFKGATGLYVLALIARAGAWDRHDAWVYLALHGVYGLLWVWKSRVFGDKNWERPVSGHRAVLLPVGLLGYWAAPWLLLQRPDPAPAPWVALCVATFAVGVFLHFAADMQKHMAMRLRPGELWTEGLWSRTRNPNYLGELCIYAAFAGLARHPVPVLIFGAIVLFEWVPNMRRKDRSLSRYPAFAEWEARSGLLLPRLDPGQRLAALVVAPLAASASIPVHAYTFALLAFVLPLVAVTPALLSEAARPWRGPLARAVAVLVPTGWLLGYAFGGRFFQYPNPGAVLGPGLDVPSDGGATRFVPGEEFAFYLLGFTFMAAMYVWRCVRDGVVPTPAPRGVGWTLLAAAPGAAGVAAYGLAPGVPGYAAFLGLVYVAVFGALAVRVGRAVHGPALGFSLGITLLLSVIWEPILALPRGWWGYVPSHMLGLWVTPGLPAEAVLVWFLGPVGCALTMHALVTGGRRR